jgi:antitoxin YefM
VQVDLWETRGFGEALEAPRDRVWVRRLAVFPAEQDTVVLVVRPPAPPVSLLTSRRFLVILLTMTVLPLGDVKSHLSELVGRVHDQHERVTVTVHGRPSAILIAPEDLEALEETLAIMRDAATMNRLAESDAELARGEYVSAEELAKTMRRRQAL